MGQSKEEKRLKQVLAKNHACYVLITCDQPTETGEMQVEMSYEGDAVMASYLIQGAQSFMDDEDETAKSTEQNKICSIDS